MGRAPRPARGQRVCGVPSYFPRQVGRPKTHTAAAIDDGVRRRTGGLAVAAGTVLPPHPSRAEPISPHLQISVRGPTNLAKRLAVISVEDSDYRVLDPREECAGLVELLAGAYLAMKVVTWFPSNALVEKWLRTALALLEAPATSVLDGASQATLAISYQSRWVAGRVFHSLLDPEFCRGHEHDRRRGVADGTHGARQWAARHDAVGTHLRPAHPSVDRVFNAFAQEHPQIYSPGPQKIYWNVLQFMF